MRECGVERLWRLVLYLLTMVDVDVVVIEEKVLAQLAAEWRRIGGDFTHCGMLRAIDVDTAGYSITRSGSSAAVMEQLSNDVNYYPLQWKYWSMDAIEDVAIMRGIYIENGDDSNTPFVSQ